MKPCSLKLSDVTSSLNDNAFGQLFLVLGFHWTMLPMIHVPVPSPGVETDFYGIFWFRLSENYTIVLYDVRDLHQSSTTLRLETGSSIKLHTLNLEALLGPENLCVV